MATVMVSMRRMNRGSFLGVLECNLVSPLVSPRRMEGFEDIRGFAVDADPTLFQSFVFSFPAVGVDLPTGG